MEVAEFPFIALDDPAIAGLGVAAVLFLLAGAVLTVRRSRPAAARWALLIGLVLAGGTIAYGLYAAWSGPHP